jgi:hypothetical protein
MTHSLSSRPGKTRILVGRPQLDARRDVARAGAAPPQVEHIHAPRAGMGLGVKCIAVPASNTRYRRRQEPTSARQPNVTHFTLLLAKMVSEGEAFQHLPPSRLTKPAIRAVACSRTDGGSGSGLVAYPRARNSTWPDCILAVPLSSVAREAVIADGRPRLCGKILVETRIRPAWDWSAAR